jgi:hypothetical protein
MNDSTRVLRRPRRAWPPTARTAAAIIATAALALAAAACSSPSSAGSAGSGGSPDPGGSASSPSAVSFSHCMRSHGVPNFPDPSGSGTLPKTSPQRLGVSDSRFQAAQGTCQHLLPSTVNNSELEQCEAAGVCSRAETQLMLNAGLRFARCMRSHGLPKWPDPTSDSQGRVAFAISISKDGFNPHSHRIDPELNNCEHLMPGGGVPLAVSP